MILCFLDLCYRKIIWDGSHELEEKIITPQAIPRAISDCLSATYIHHITNLHSLLWVLLSSFLSNWHLYTSLYSLWVFTSFWGFPLVIKVWLKKESSLHKQSYCCKPKSDCATKQTWHVLYFGLMCNGQTFVSHMSKVISASKV